MHAGDRREQHAGEPGKADAERRNRGHIGRKRDAERADDVRILDAGAHDPAECGAVDDEPGRRHRDHGDEQDEEPVARVDEVAEQNLSAQFRRYRERQRRRTEHDPQALLDHHSKAEREQQAQDRIGAIETAKQQPLGDDADDADDNGRDHERAGEADAVGEHDRKIGADRVEAAMRQIDDAAERKDQRKAKRNEQVIGSDQEPVENLLNDEDDLHARAPSPAFQGKEVLHPLSRRTVGFTRSCRCRPWAER